MARKKTTPKDFAGALEELDTLVEDMEGGELTLEQSLTHFEKGINLIKHCQTVLTEAEQKVIKLSKKTLTEQALDEDFDEDDLEEDDKDYEDE